MSHDPYIVVGTGRSGTSTVAGILHNKMGVFMGHEFPPANPANPSGFWEDIEFYRANKAFDFGKINYPTWIKEVLRIIAERLALDRLWGFKEGRMADLLGLYLGFFKNPKIIRCKRKKELVVASLARCYKFIPVNPGIDYKQIDTLSPEFLEQNKELAETFWHKRETMLDNTLSGKDYLTIDFGEKKLLDKEIMKSIGGKWNGEG